MCSGRNNWIDTQFGRFFVRELASGELSTRWVHEGDPPATDAARDAEFATCLIDRLARYFSGDVTVSFAETPIPEGPPFFRACWAACREIPPGQTRSYAELAEMAGRPGAARAAGQAMRRNPLPVIVPCHRVVGAAGDLRGFAGSSDPSGPELSLKAALLTHEGAICTAPLPADAGARTRPEPTNHLWS